jgi:hypothetical protein
MIQLEEPLSPSPSPQKRGQTPAKASPSPALRQPKLVTTDLALDATSAPLWIGAA